MEDKDVRKGCHEQLLRTSLLLALVALPVGNLYGRNSLSNTLNQRLLALRRCYRELDELVRPHVRIVTVAALDLVAHVEAHQLVEIRELVAQKLEQLVAVADAFARRHECCLDALVEVGETIIPSTCPNLLEGHVDGICIICLTVGIAGLNVRDTKDCLNSCIYPAAARLIAETKHLV